MRKANILLRELFTFHGGERVEAAGQREQRADEHTKVFFFFFYYFLEILKCSECLKENLLCHLL